MDLLQTRKVSKRAISVIWCLVAIPSFLSFGYTRVAAGDLWWHLAIGRWILEHRWIPTVDSWSFTRHGQPWLQHEWLSSVLFQVVAVLLGMPFLVYVKWLVLVASFLLLFRLTWRISGEPISSYLSVLLAAAVAAPFLDIRPQLFSILGYVVLLCLTLDRPKPPLYLPMIFLVWANLHAGFFFGLMALSVLLSPILISGTMGERRRAALIWIASVLVCLLNPNGLRDFIYPLKYAFDRKSPFQAIGEWVPPFEFEPGGINSFLYPYAIGIFVCASIFLLLRRREKNRQVPWVRLTLGVLTLAMSLTSRRFVTLFAISQSLITSEALAILIGPAVRRIPLLIAPALVALFGIVLLRPYPLAPYAFHYLTAEDEFPIETLNFIELNQLSGKVLAYYNWGGYVHLRSNGRMQVFIDGRADTVYDSETLLRYAKIQGFRPGWEDVLESSGAEFILWPRSDKGKPLAQLVTSGRWRLLFGDAVSVLLVRSDRMPVAPLKPTPDSAYRRLSSGVQYFEQGRYDFAEQALKGALEQMPYLRTALLKLAQAEALQGKKEDALRTVKRGEEFFPDPQLAASIKPLVR